MHVTVAIPTLGDRDSLFETLTRLRKQSHRDFDVLIVTRPLSKARMSLIDKFVNGRFDYSIVVQRRGFFAEALDLVYGKAKGDVVINTDDDALPSRDWIRDHAAIHARHKGIGMATGIVVEKKGLLNKNKWLMNAWGVIDRPIDARFSGYDMYIGKSGMMVDTGTRKNMRNTFAQHGVNMSWKHEALHGFRLPGQGITEHHNEAMAALESINRGFSTIYFDGAVVHHTHNVSTSRKPQMPFVNRGIIAESVTFACFVSRFYRVDLDILRLRTNIGAMFDGEYKLGFAIAERAIREKWPPARLRKELLREIRDAS